MLRTELCLIGGQGKITLKNLLTNFFLAEDLLEHVKLTRKSGEVLLHIWPQHLTHL